MMIHTVTPTFPVETGRTRSVIDGLTVDWGPTDNGGLPPTVAQVRAIMPVVPVTLTDAAKTSAQNSMTATDGISVRQRSESRQVFVYLKQLFDGENATRLWTTQMKAAVAASTSFADLKVRIAALSTLTNLTVPTRVDMKAAVVAFINADDPNA